MGAGRYTNYMYALIYPLNYTSYAMEELPGQTTKSQFFSNGYLEIKKNNIELKQ